MNKILLITVLLIIVIIIFGYGDKEVGQYDLYEFTSGQENPNSKVDVSEWLDETSGYETKDLSGSISLVKYGPREFYREETSSGECGACLNEKIDMFIIDHNKDEIRNVLNLHSVENVCEIDYEYRVSDDWITVTQFAGDYTNLEESGGIVWASESYCFDKSSNRFNTCGTGNTPPIDYEYSVLGDGWCGEALY